MSRTAAMNAYVTAVVAHRRAVTPWDLLAAAERLTAARRALVKAVAS